MQGSSSVKEGDASELVAEPEVKQRSFEIKDSGDE
jgi:hypothetical protein